MLSEKKGTMTLTGGRAFFVPAGFISKGNGMSNLDWVEHWLVLVDDNGTVKGKNFYKEDQARLYKHELRTLYPRARTWIQHGL